MGGKHTGNFLTKDKQSTKPDLRLIDDKNRFYPSKELFTVL